MDDEHVLSDGLAKLASGVDSAKAVTKIVSKLMSTKNVERTFTVRAAAAEAKRSSFVALNEIGDVLEGADNPEGSFRISAVVNSGFLSMNPCLIHLSIVAENAGATTILIIAKAKEGIIKQSTTQKPISKFLTQLHQILPTREMQLPDLASSPPWLGS